MLFGVFGIWQCVLTHDEANGVFKCTSVLPCFLDLDWYCWCSLVWVSKMDFLTEMCSVLKADFRCNLMKWFQTVFKGFLNLQIDLKHSLSVQNNFNSCICYNVKFYSADWTPPFVHLGLRIYPTIDGFCWNDPTGKHIDCLSEVWSLEVHTHSLYTKKWDPAMM